MPLAPPRPGVILTVYTCFFLSGLALQLARFIFSGHTYFFESGVALQFPGAFKAGPVYEHG